MWEPGHIKPYGLATRRYAPNATEKKDSWLRNLSPVIQAEEYWIFLKSSNLKNFAQAFPGSRVFFFKSSPKSCIPAYPCVYAPEPFDKLQNTGKLSLHGWFTQLSCSTVSTTSISSSWAKSGLSGRRRTAIGDLPAQYGCLRHEALLEALQGCLRCLHGTKEHALSFVLRGAVCHGLLWASWTCVLQSQAMILFAKPHQSVFVVLLFATKLTRLTEIRSTRITQTFCPHVGPLHRRNLRLVVAT